MGWAEGCRAGSPRKDFFCDQSLGNNCSLSFLHLFSADAFSLFHPSPFSTLLTCHFTLLLSSALTFPRKLPICVPQKQKLPLFTVPWHFLLKPCSLPFHFASTPLQGQRFNTDFSCSLLHIIVRWEQLNLSSAPHKGHSWMFLRRTNVKGIFQSGV